jgi:hypothetical protein
MNVGFETKIVFGNDLSELVVFRSTLSLVPLQLLLLLLLLLSVAF